MINGGETFNFKSKGQVENVKFQIRMYICEVFIEGRDLPLIRIKEHIRLVWVKGL